MDDIPPLVTPAGWWARLWYKTCPACGRRFLNGLFQMSLAGYPMHCAAAHLSIRPLTRSR